MFCQSPTSSVVMNLCAGPLRCILWETLLKISNLNGDLISYLFFSHAPPIRFAFYFLSSSCPLFLGAPFLPGKRIRGWAAVRASVAFIPCGQTFCNHSRLFLSRLFPLNGDFKVCSTVRRTNRITSRRTRKKREGIEKQWCGSCPGCFVLFPPLCQVFFSV